MAKITYEKGVRQNWWRCLNCNRKWITEEDAQQCCPSSNSNKEKVARLENNYMAQFKTKEKDVSERRN